VVTYQYDYQQNTTRSVQQFTFTTTVTCHSLGLEAPLRPEARGICHICHMVNPALTTPFQIVDETPHLTNFGDV